MKKLIIFIGFLIFVFIIFFSSNYKDINDISIIKTIAINYNNGLTTLTANKIAPIKGENVSNYDINSIVISDNSLDNCINFLSKNITDIDLNHIELLIIDSYYYDNFNYIYDTFNNLDIRNNFLITVIDNNTNIINNNDISSILVKKLKENNITFNKVISSYLDINYLYIPSIKESDIYE